jgi:hypothetical protein
MPARIEEKNGVEISSPDNYRIGEAQKQQKKLGQALRLYGIINERLYHNFKRLECDVKQINQTTLMIRENIKSLQNVELTLSKELNINTDKW